MSDDMKKRQEPPQATESELSTADLAASSQRASTAGTKVGDTGKTGTGAATAKAMEPETGPLFASSEASDLRGKWDAIQVGFVDEPRQAVQDADNLVAGTMKRLAEIFADERNKLESQWSKGENVSTEDLRLALRRYRSFFSRLLSV